MPRPPTYGRVHVTGDLAWGRRRHHPAFITAVLADARVTAYHRGERTEFRSRLDALIQVLRLAWVTDAFLAQCCYRAKAQAQARGIPVVPHLLHHLALVTGQVCIGDPVVMHPGVYLPQGNLVIDGVTAVASFSVIHGSVTIGLVDANLEGPTIEAGVTIGPGARVIGPVKVGAGASIEANAVVLRDVEPGATVAGVPARPVDPVAAAQRGQGRTAAGVPTRIASPDPPDVTEIAATDP